jgi:hypothetical protein
VLARFVDDLAHIFVVHESYDLGVVHQRGVITRRNGLRNFRIGQNRQDGGIVFCNTSTIPSSFGSSAMRDFPESSTPASAEDAAGGNPTLDPVADLPFSSTRESSNCLERQSMPNRRFLRCSPVVAALESTGRVFAAEFVPAFV